MTILCGADWTEPSARAVEVAAALAARMREPLRLVHVFDLPGAEAVLRDRPTPSASRIRSFVEAEHRELEERLRAEAQRLARPGLAVETAVLFGLSDQAIIAESERIAASLIVVGAIGRRSGPLWNLGSTADRIAQAARRPVLVVRDPDRILGWTRGEGPLRVVVGVDASGVSDAAVLWIENLRRAGPCTVVGAHVYWPPEVRERLKLGGAIPIGAGHPDVDAALKRELEARLAKIAGTSDVELVIVGGLGRIADHVVEIARDHDAHLVVVGSHQRGGFDRLWHGSVSRGVIDAAPVSVLSVPSRQP